MHATASVATGPRVRLGLRANVAQFSLLVLVNAFVGAMVGVERSVLPLVAERDFGLAAGAPALSFIAGFGVAKAVTNLFAGGLADRLGRKPLLVAGWLIGLPVPLVIIGAPAWGWIVLANVLLGVNQGLCWSTTIIMKVDLAGPARRGLAMGLNEFAGYLAVALASLAAGFLAGAYGLRPFPFLLGLGIAAIGLALSAIAVRETRGHARFEAAEMSGPGAGRPSLAAVFARTSWRDRTLFAVSQAGHVNNLNDALAWGIFPLLFAAGGLPLPEIGLLAALYPAVWSLSQVGFGLLSDRFGRKPLIAAGMLLQAGALGWMALAEGLGVWGAGTVLLGLGTGMVYPTLLAAVGDRAAPPRRGAAIGVYRLWRDAGYVAGALLAGSAAASLGLRPAIGLVGGVTLASGLVVLAAMQETLARASGDEQKMNGRGTSAGYHATDETG